MNIYLTKIKELLKNTPIRPLYWKLRNLPPFRQIRRALNMRQRDLRYGRQFPAYYAHYADRPLDRRKVIFVEDRYDSLSDNFRLLYNDLTASGKYRIHVHFLHQFSVPREEYERNCCALLADAATAKYIFLNDASPVIGCVALRPETIVTQLWHGCGAFKKFGASTEDKLFGDDQKTRQKHPAPYYKNLTHVTVSSPEVVWAYEEAMSLENRPGVVKPVGISRTDVFFDPAFIRDSVQKVHDFFPASEGKKIILFAPTFRGRVANATTPDYEEHFQLRKLAQALGDQYVIITKLHPYVRGERIPQIPEDLKGSFAADASGVLSIDELLCAADICISDYSSLIYEYSLFERPMIFYAYDLDDYFDWRGFYYNYDELTPGPVCRTTGEIIDCIRHIDERFDPQQVAAFRSLFMGSCDGHATERIEELVFGHSLR